ncbi:7955_t:CDS:2 [Gigaspora rosea]|nr:7955_t:CDS:2 [Gigaspora rosea]
MTIQLEEAKAKQAGKDLNHIMMPAESNVGIDILQYIRDCYANLNKAERIDMAAAEKITAALPQVTSSMNKGLVKRITQDNIREAHIVKDRELSTAFKVERGYFKLTAYTDDLTIDIGRISDEEKVEELFDLYEAASNARIN